MNPWTDVPTLVGRHVTLRPLLRADRAALLAAYAPLTGQFTTVIPTDDTIDAWFEVAEEQHAAGRQLPFAVLDADGIVAGSTRFRRMSRKDRRVEIGTTAYAPRVQRTGLNTEAKRMLLAHAFETMDCQCVQIRTDFYNRRSRAAIERLGARLDGVLRGHSVMPDGRVRDTVVYSILTQEWPGVRQNLDALLSAGKEQRL